MEKAFLDFQKIKPYGNMGDGGNDGYRKELGIYYQVYAPDTPKIKESEAAKKLEVDFQKLKNEWKEISQIKEYHFVFNDKYSGSIQLLEKVVTDLQINNPNIEFKLFLAKDLEKIFFSFNETDILNLGFNIDSREAIANAYKYLEKVEIELDRENANFALKILENSKDIISNLDDDRLILEYEILECKCMQKLEKVDEAKEKYINISKRFTNDSRAFLYLSEIYLGDNDFDKNKEYLAKAKTIDADSWLLKLEYIVRQNHLNGHVDLKDIDEKTFSDNRKVKSNFYRLYANLLETSGDNINADSFIEQAIYYNPNRLSNYLVKLSFMQNRLFSNQDISQTLKQAQELLKEIEKIETKFSSYGAIGARSQAILNINKIYAIHIEENFQELEKMIERTFKLLITCYFDKSIDHMLSILLKLAGMPNYEIERLLEYLRNSKNEISDNFAKALIAQFNMEKILFTEGRKFFKETCNQKYIDFIDNIEKKNYEDVLKLLELENDTQFSIMIANTLKDFPELRIKIIESLPDDKNIQKEKLLFLLNFDEKNSDEAFDALKQIDLKNLNYLECIPILKIIQEKKAWDFEIIVLNKLLEKEENKKEIFNLNIQLFNAYCNLHKYPEAIEAGEELLTEDSINHFLDKENMEALLTQTLLACLKRGKADNTALQKSKEILEKYPLSQPSFEFKAGTEAEVYLKNEDPNKALESIIEGVKIKKVFTPEEYAQLYFVMSINIQSKIDLKLESLDKVEENTFVKLNNEDRWYFIGSDNELDAVKISKENDMYQLFIDQMIENKIVFKTKYSSEVREKTIEKIFTIEKYILWQVIQSFQKSSKQNTLKDVQVIEIPEHEGNIDLKYLLNFLEDSKKGTEAFFEIYCQDNNLPFAMLAANEGGVVNAIGRIQGEQKGFINFSSGSLEELEKQKNVAKNIIVNQKPFYIDGTSALMLAEMGLFKKICKYLPNLKVPQSVINLLIILAEKFRYVSGQTGNMGYAQGKITFSSIEKEKRDRIRSNFLESIQLLEAEPANVSVISMANKINCFSEQEVPEELCDACILAQKENLPVLTEDYLYLNMNELETKKNSPEYTSSLILLKILYEEGKIDFDNYLDFFGYLSSYRLRFLSLDSNDIEKAVFGDGATKTINSENIKKLNFPLTLSEEYGVSFQIAFNVVGTFLLKILLDDTIPSEETKKVFIEIVELFPTKLDKKTFGGTLLSVCIEAVKQNKLNPTDKLRIKIDELLQTIEIFNSEMQLNTLN